MPPARHALAVAAAGALLVPGSAAASASALAPAPDAPAAPSLTAPAGAASPLPARPAPQLAALASDPARLDAVLAAALRELDAPGATAAVIDRGRLVWQGAAGLAVDPAAEPAKLGAPSAATAVAQRPDTLAPLASLTQSYTAVVILRLAEQRRLRLDETIDRWLPTVPEARRVTVRQLLDHTAGYPDVAADPHVLRITGDRARRDPDHRWTRHELIGRTRAPTFAPGTRWAYSSTNYLLLGELAERAGRAPFARLLDRFVTRPLGLADTLMRRGGPLPLDRFAHGHLVIDGARLDSWSGARSVPTDVYGPVWTDRGIAATAADAARFCDGLYRAGALLRPSTLRTMTRTLGPAARHGHGLGTHRFDVGAAGRWQGFVGASGGSSSMAATNLATGVTIAVLSNALRLEPHDAPAPHLWQQLAAALAQRPARAGAQAAAVARNARR